MRQHGLTKLILNGTFRAGRHAHLLLSESLPEGAPIEHASAATEAAWNELVELERAAKQEDLSDPWAFSTAVREFHAARRRGPRLEALKERLRAVVGTPASAWVRAGMPPDTWRKWNSKHGFAWRTLHGCPNLRDQQRLAAGEKLPKGSAPAPPQLPVPR